MVPDSSARLTEARSPSPTGIGKRIGYADITAKPAGSASDFINRTGPPGTRVLPGGSDPE